jgi:hypothetical protein
MPDQIKTEATPTPRYPIGLVDWSGQHSGGVRKPFYDSSGRPCRAVIETPLLAKVRDWVRAAVSNPDAPRCLLLVGGPGNGKTEAVEALVRDVDEVLGVDGGLVREFTMTYSGQGGVAIPRLVSVGLKPNRGGRPRICLVQDASVNDAAHPGKSAADLLVSDFSTYLVEASRDVYIACVNRGILDDALTSATDQRKAAEQKLLEAAVRSVGQSPSSPSCWPLEGFAHVSVWPMDVETLVWVRGEDKQASPAEQLFNHATDSALWPVVACAAGDQCPFCRSRATLAKDTHRDNLLRILRWNELATGKRWSFRDLFSLASYVLAGASPQESGDAVDPCAWAAKLVELSQRTSGAKESARLRAPFQLVAAQYEHALFGTWPRLGTRGLRADINELQLETDSGLMGLHYFLSSRREVAIPGTLEQQLEALVDALDPAVADPSATIRLSTRDLHLGNEVDATFSHSVADGLSHVRRVLSPAEASLIERLAESDEKLSRPDVRRRRPAIAKRLQSLVRDFTCRLVRRSLGVRYGITREHELLAEFEKVVAGDVTLLHKAVKHVEALINQREQFVVVLNSTFGEPLAPPPRRATLHTAREKVRPVDPATAGRPTSPVRFLSVGGKEHALALTYDLFRSVRELEGGMLPASLPRPVVALLDATRARIGGLVVRDEDKLDGAEIRVRDTVITRELGAFVVTQGDAR